MAHLDSDALENIFHLSKIECREEELSTLLSDMESILEHMDLLSEIDTEGVEPCNHVLQGFSNATREDEVGRTLSREAFLANAADHVGGMVRVPPVLKQ